MKANPQLSYPRTAADVVSGTARVKGQRGDSRSNSRSDVGGALDARAGHHMIRAAEAGLMPERADQEIASLPAMVTEPRLLLRIEEAAERLGIGRSLMYRLVMSGAVESVPLGRLRRIPSECLQDFIDRLRAETRSVKESADG